MNSFFVSSGLSLSVKMCGSQAKEYSEIIQIMAKSRDSGS